MEKDLPNILIVDDNSFNIFTLETVIQDLNSALKCDSAINGLAALEAVKSRMEEACKYGKCSNEDSMYKLILMDCNMPIMDGFESTKAIRDLIPCPSIGKMRNFPYIVALTAYSTDSFKQKCLQAGMNEFLTKPIEVDKLELLLQNLKILPPSTSDGLTSSLQTK